MRSGAAAGHRGHFHEAVLYRSERDLLDVVVPFLRGGLETGEPTIVALGDGNAALVRDALPEAVPALSFLGGDVYTRPATAIKSYRRLLADHVAAGARQVRILGEVPPAALGPTWDWWARYESAVNHAYDDYPLWSMCAYDAMNTPGAVLEDVIRTHPRTATPDGHVANDRYTPPPRFLGERRTLEADPIQRESPVLALTDPSPGAARRAIRDLDPGLATDDFDGLLIAVSEVVTNALRHGRPPVRVRYWAAPDRIVVTVHDGGSGPTDPFAGLLPVAGRGGGLGLWLSHQLCNHVALDRSGDGFGVRLTAGNPHTPR
jgi:anti-sigma regulatory factor (Ser/Thr protein kinase)